MILKDKNGIILKEGDFIMWNPDDDDWLDIIISHHGELMSAYELGSTNPDKLLLKDSLFGSDNPVLKVGNIHDNCVEISEF